MAGVRFAVVAENVSHATSTLTMLSLTAAANRRVRVERIVVSGQGTLNTDKPVTFELIESSAAGTATSVTPIKLVDSDSESIGLTSKSTYTVEPTYTAAPKEARAIHPQSCQELVFAPMRELYINGGNTLNVRVNSPAQAETWNITAYCEE